MKEIVLINLLITIFCWLIFSFLYYRYYYQIKIDDKRYKLFELRDSLSILVLNKIISVESREYNFVLSMLNYYIKILENYNFSDYIKSFIILQENITIKKELEYVVDNLKNNLELGRILYEFNHTIYSVLEMNCFFFRLFLKLIKKLKLDYFIFIPIMRFVAAIKEFFSIQKTLKQRLSFISLS